MKLSAKQRKILVITIFIISVFFWFVLFSLPLWPIKGKMKITTGTICFIMGEVLFYLAAFVLGRELYLKFKSRLSPRNWFRKG
jgi:hypothetical protein